MANIKDMVVDRLEAGERVELDEFGIEYVTKVTGSCRACESHYRRTHGGWGSICYECDEPWPDLRGMIEEAHGLGLLRHAPAELDLTSPLQLDLSTTGLTGVEFTYNPEADEIVDAWRTVDGEQLTADEFIARLKEALNDAQ